MDRLLVEIGTEEIPAGYINPALDALAAGLVKKLADSRIVCGRAATYGTPRRLSIIIDDIAARQTRLNTEILGPSEKAAVDADGKFTLAVAKFAEKHGVPVRSLDIKDTGKGRYLYAVKTEKGLAAIQILKEILPEVILSLPFPKTMRWAGLRIEFARPIHSIAALLGERVVSFQVGDVRSSRYTFGHRFMAPGRIKLSSAGDYLDALRSAWVLADILQRRKMLLEETEKAVAKISVRIIDDPELVDLNTNLVEYPVVVVGDFDEKFLELPAPILITAMKEHQRYFAVVDKHDNIMPHFAAVNNTRAADMGLVVRGHERVLRARLEDARFFYTADTRISLDAMTEKLHSVLFQAELGSVYDKTVRIRKTAAVLAGALGLSDHEKMHISRAAFLCKADLVSRVVGEFPKLQGIMGGVYARVAAEPESVARAIEEHYRPTFSGGPLPETLEGAVLAVSDKLDTICGCFHIGRIPTGASDPYALRRQGIGIVQIALKENFSFSLKRLISECLALFPTSPDPGVAGRIYDFFKGRMAHLLESEGISKDAVAAVLAAHDDDIPAIWKRAHALQKLKFMPDFEILAVAFKRVVNIIKKSNEEGRAAAEVNPALFEYDAEKILHRSFSVMKSRVEECLEKGDMEAAFVNIAGLRDNVDRFFDDVLVMTDDTALRQNRLALLGAISRLFERLADFSKLST